MKSNHVSNNDNIHTDREQPIRSNCFFDHGEIEINSGYNNQKIVSDIISGNNEIRSYLHANVNVAVQSSPVTQSPFLSGKQGHRGGGLREISFQMQKSAEPRKTINHNDRRINELQSDNLLKVNILKQHVDAIAATSHFSNQSKELNSKLNNQFYDTLQKFPEFHYAGDSKILSDKELCEQSATVIGNIQDKYMTIYQDAVRKMTAFYQDFSDMVSSKLASSVKSGDDGKNIDISVFDMRAAVYQFMDKYFMTSQAIKPGQHKDDSAPSHVWIDGSDNTVGRQVTPKDSSLLFVAKTQEEAEGWIKKFGMGRVDKSHDNPPLYKVCIEFKPLELIFNSMLYANLKGNGRDNGAIRTVDSAKYQAWKAGFDLNDETYKNGLQRLAQKYSQENSAVDNLYKVLSSMISQLFGLSKDVFNNLR